MRVGGERHALATLLMGKRPGIHCIGGWVGPKAGLDRAENFSPSGIRSLDRPARSESLYQLRCCYQIRLLIIMYIYTVWNKSLCSYKRCWQWFPQQKHIPQLKEPQWVKTELNNYTLYRYCTSTAVQQLNTVKQQHTATATSILTTKSTYHSLSAQLLSEHTVFSLFMWETTI
jgi:hypothetical protein